MNEAKVKILKDSAYQNKHLITAFKHGGEDCEDFQGQMLVHLSTAKLQQNA